MTGFLESLRIENLKKGLHVLIAAPGFTSSNIRENALSASGENQKESPRLKWAETILNKMGIKTITTNDSIKICYDDEIRLIIINYNIYLISFVKKLL